MVYTPSLREDKFFLQFGFVSVGEKRRLARPRVLHQVQVLAGVGQSEPLLRLRPAVVPPGPKGYDGLETKAVEGVDVGEVHDRRYLSGSPPNESVCCLIPLRVPFGVRGWLSHSRVPWVPSCATSGTGPGAGGYGRSAETLGEMNVPWTCGPGYQLGPLRVRPPVGGPTDRVVVVVPRTRVRRRPRCTWVRGGVSYGQGDHVGDPIGFRPGSVLGVHLSRCREVYLSRPLRRVPSSRFLVLVESTRVVRGLWRRETGKGGFGGYPRAPDLAGVDLDP